MQTITSQTTNNEISIPSFALVGNPNSGKTTIFNALTGSRQKIGNYSGVTIERKEGTFFSQHGKPLKIIDLPGSYSVTPSSPEEEIMQNVLIGKQYETPKPDYIICVIDASHLERNLYFATQILELGIPSIIVLNMVDIAKKNGISLNINKLENLLGTKVIPTQGNSKKSIINLKLAISQYKNLIPNVQKTSPIFSIKKILHLATEETLVANRYKQVEAICSEVINSPSNYRPSITDRLDNLLLHPILGFPILAAILGAMFFSIFSLAEIPMRWIETFITYTKTQVSFLLPPGPIQELISNGILSGVGGVLLFLPQILALFFFIGLLESTGYMARAAFILDKLMSRVGLPGKAFIPILSSHACAVPSIMATRTLKSEKDRLTTILVAPFTSCSARLPIYLLMIAAIVPSHEKYSALYKSLFLIGAYSLGLFITFLSAWILKKTILSEKNSSSIMELPSYKLPSLKNITREMLERGKIFIKRAGTIILGISIILWFLLNYPKVPDETPLSQLEYSFAGRIGKVIEPTIEPLGYDWKIGIGILSSFAAREVFVGTMSVIYNVNNANNELKADTLHTILQKQKRSDGSKLFTPLVCLSLIIFYIFALQCMSTIAVVARETNSLKWPLFQFIYMTTVAYVAALVIYQLGKFIGYA